VAADASAAGHVVVMPGCGVRWLKSLMLLGE
jgi:hypothetical protein